MVNLHRVGFHNTETSKGNLPVDEIDKDDVNQSLIDSWYHHGSISRVKFSIVSNGIDI